MKAMDELIETIDKYWKFDENQNPVSTWHDKQDLLELLRNKATELNKSEWVSVSERLPVALETVWISNGAGWTTLGCLVETQEGWHWAETNGIIYQENGKIVSECESDDLDVTHWQPLPTPPINH